MKTVWLKWGSLRESRAPVQHHAMYQDRVRHELVEAPFLYVPLPDLLGNIHVQRSKFCTQLVYETWRIVAPENFVAFCIQTVDNLWRSSLPRKTLARTYR